MDLSCIIGLYVRLHPAAAGWFAIRLNSTIPLNPLNYKPDIRWPVFALRATPRHADDRMQMTEHRWHRSDDRGQVTEDRWQRTGDRRQMTEDRWQRSEDRRQRSEDRN